MKVIGLVCLASGAIADVKHPVRLEMVEEIKAKTQSWTPREVHENHFAKVPADQIKNRFGNMGVELFSAGDSITNMFKSLFNIKAESDSDVVQQKKEVVDEPKSHPLL